MGKKYVVPLNEAIAGVLHGRAGTLTPVAGIASAPCRG
jgi:hypothetical protein